MTSLAAEVDRVLNRLDPVTSELFDRAVRDAIALAERIAPAEPQAVDAMGYPLGYFEENFGALAGQPFDEPDDPPPQAREDW